MSEKKKLYSFRPMFRLMFNNLTKLAKILTREFNATGFVSFQ